MVKPHAIRYKRGMDQATPEQLRAVTRAAVVRRDYCRWLSRALRQRAERGLEHAHGFGDAYDADLMRAAADELLALVDPEQAA